MRRIGTLEKQRLTNIPKNRHACHEFCFHLHDSMVHLLKQMEIQKAGHVHFEFESTKERELFESGIHVLDFLNKTGRADLERRVVINQVCLALFSDMLHYIYEGLRALEKRKFSVAFTLLRKPCKEGLLLVAQMCANEEDFFTQLKYDAKSLLNRKAWSEDRIKMLLKSALESCGGSIFTSPDILYKSIFSRKNNAGLAAIFDKAAHLITEFSQIQTENYNINFILKNPRDNDIYEGDTYQQIATILLIFNLIQIELYSRMSTTSNKYIQWIIITSLGTYEALFISGKSSMANFVNHQLSDFLECPICQAKLKVKKRDIPRLFIGETLDCNICRTSHHFPFGWLLSKVDVKFSPFS